MELERLNAKPSVFTRRPYLVAIPLDTQMRRKGALVSQVADLGGVVYTGRTLTLTRSPRGYLIEIRPAFSADPDEWAELATHLPEDAEISPDDWLYVESENVELIPILL